MKQGQRDHSWDAMRAFLMILGIPYHIALSYRPGQDWIVRSGEGLPIFTYLAEFIHLFRMPAFFVIAGYFAALLLARRDPVAWLQGRVQRLVPPALACLILLVPLMNLVCELSNLALPEALSSWAHNSAVSGGYWVRHLWFIVVLLYCSAALALVAWWRPALRTAMLRPTTDRWLARYHVAVLFGVALLLGAWEAGAVEMFYIAGLATNLPQQILRIDELIAYAPYFLLGVFLARAPQLMAAFSRFSPEITVIGIATAAGSLALLDALSPSLGRFLATFAALTLTQMLIVVARRYLSKPIPLVQRLVAASFVIYLVHMPVVVLLVWLGHYLALPVAIKAIAITGLTLLLSYGIWQHLSRLSVAPLLGALAPPRNGSLRLQPA
ncbi:acyltransferase family protein [Sphingomonas sp. C3-2]|uniref:acyltransferase family protein n=1 Tax=Sphingomonas sp. C3-2 TaxID=3062169 RepID=UPI00294B534B|nr:acyltransferase family protein [Sphingomonas sp. C3-2]WOK37926.1 acyltransferase family protein [Sphingomonas sp. C3-2]